MTGNPRPMPLDIEEPDPAGNGDGPRCALFGECGGCLYQDVRYEEELRVKEDGLKKLFSAREALNAAVFDPIVPSPKIYHYRNRLDMTFLRTRTGECFMGFMPEGRFRILPVEKCAIAREEISDFLPGLREEAAAKLPADYRIANLVIRTGDDGSVFWGGIGRGSLKLKEEDFFWTEPYGKRIYYSLDTFFQANLSILPALLEKIESLAGLDRETLFADLYSGVGLFGISFADKVKKAVLIEESGPSIKVAHFNAASNGLTNVDIRLGKVETELGGILGAEGFGKRIAIVDPPRAGLSAQAGRALSAEKKLDALFYLSCSPQSLIRDLCVFMERGWRIARVIPFDFFPRTRHLETLVLLDPPS